MAVVKELDWVLSGKVISGTGGSFHRNLDLMFSTVIFARSRIQIIDTSVIIETLRVYA